MACSRSSPLASTFIGSIARRQKRIPPVSGFPWRLHRESRRPFGPQPEFMHGLAEVERATGGLEAVVNDLNNDPVVLTAVDLVAIEGTARQDGAVQADSQRPTGVVQRIDRYSAAVLPVAVALRGVPGL